MQNWGKESEKINSLFGDKKWKNSFPQYIVFSRKLFFGKYAFFGSLDFTGFAGFENRENPEKRAEKFIFREKIGKSGHFSEEL